MKVMKLPYHLQKTLLVFENNPGVEFTLPVTDNNISSFIFPTGSLSDFVGYEIYVDVDDYYYYYYSDYITVSENYIINEDGSVGILILVVAIHLLQII